MVLLLHESMRRDRHRNVAAEPSYIVIRTPQYRKPDLFKLARLMTVDICSWTFSTSCTYANHYITTVVIKWKRIIRPFFVVAYFITGWIAVSQQTQRKAEYCYFNCTRHYVICIANSTTSLCHLCSNLLLTQSKQNAGQPVPRALLCWASKLQ